MSILQKLIVLAFISVVAMFGTAGGCDDSGGSSVSCESALDNFYDADCTLIMVYYDGYEFVSESEAVEGCEDTKEDAKEEGCTKEFNEALRCMNNAEDEDDCDDCDNELEDMYTCID